MTDLATLGTAPARSSHGWVVTSWALLAITVFLALPLLLIEIYLLAWFWPAPTRGATCDLGFQPWCERGHGLVAYYVTAAAVLGAVTLWVLALVAAARRRAGRSIALLLAAVTSVAVGLAAAAQLS